jgi:hypothetical protein
VKRVLVKRNAESWKKKTTSYENEKIILSLSLPLRPLTRGLIPPSSLSNTAISITKKAPIHPAPVVQRMQKSHLPRQLHLPHQMPVVLLRQAGPPPWRELASLGQQALQDFGVPEVDHGPGSLFGGVADEEDALGG